MVQQMLNVFVGEAALTGCSYVPGSVLSAFPVLSQ